MTHRRRSGRVIVVGAGVAGLSAAWHLSRRGVEVLVIEREGMAAAHASGRNAAIFRTTDDRGVPCEHATRSRQLLEQLAPGALRQTGALFVTRAHHAAADGEETRPHDSRFEPDDGVLDIHSVTQALLSESRRAGTQVLFDREVAQLCVEGARLLGVGLADGTRLEASAVVIAGGAWSAELAERSGLPLPLEVLRRHLVSLAYPSVPHAPIVWCLDPDRETYFRSESGGVLASPCDEDPVAPSADPPTSQEVVGRLAQRLAPWAPGLAQAGVRRSWACLRTFAPDREFVVGPDARAEGLFWFAGLGGRGMSCALALGELLASTMLDGTSAGQFAVSRITRSA